MGTGDFPRESQSTAGGRVRPDGLQDVQHDRLFVFLDHALAHLAGGVRQSTDDFGPCPPRCCRAASINRATMLSPLVGMMKE